MPKKLSQTNYLKIICLIIATLLTIKAYITPFTYDEAYSYLSYVRTNDLLTVNIANNHLLNTILMGIFSIFGNSEFILRLPNLLSGFIYIYIGYRISTKLNNSLLILIFILLNPTVFDFLSLARGYGISATLNLLGIYIFLFSDAKQKYLFSLTFFWLSSLAIYTNLITLFSFIFLNFIIEKRVFLNLKTTLINIIYISLSVPIAFKLFEITQTSKPLFGRNINIDTVERVYTFFGFLKTYFISSHLLNIIFLFIFLFVIKNFEQSLNSKFVISLFIVILLCLILVPLIFNRPLPVERLLIPFIPFFQISVCFVFTNIKNKLVISLLSFVLILNFSINLDLNTSIYWDDFIDTNQISNSIYCETLDSTRPEYIYYKESRGYC
jgi:hypothetical protein